MSLVLPSVQAREGNRVTWKTQWWCSYVFAVHMPRLSQLTTLWCDPVSLSLSLSPSLSLTNTMCYSTLRKTPHLNSQQQIHMFFYFEVTWGQVWWPIFGICALHLTHPSAHTLVNTCCEHTPGAVGSQCCGTRGAVGGSVPSSRVSPQSWYWTGGENTHYSLLPPTVATGTEIRTHNLGLQVRRPIH